MTRHGLTYGFPPLKGRCFYSILFMLMLCLSPTPSSAAIVSGSINVDKVTTETIVAGLTAQLAAERLNSEELNNMLKRYSESSLALTGIWASKQLQVRAQRKGEKFYYDRIRFRLEKQILPKIFVLGALFLEHPDQVLNWGPFLTKVVDDTAQLAMIFEYVVTNCEVSFADLPWLFINDDIRQILDLARLGNTDWKTLLSKLADFPSLGSDSTNIDLVLPDIKSVVADATTNITSAANNIENIIGEGGDLAGAIGGSSGVIGEALHTKIRDWKRLKDQFSEFYGSLADGYHYIQDFKDRIDQQVHMATSVVDQVQSQFNTLKSDFTPEHLLRTAALFKINGYSIDEYIMRYINNIAGKYYRKRFWIEKAGYEDKQITWNNPNDKPIDEAQLGNNGMYYINFINMGFECNLIEAVINGAANHGWFLKGIDWGSYPQYTMKCNFDEYMNTAEENAKDYCNQMSGFTTLSGVQSIEYTKRTATVHENLINNWGWGQPIEHDLYITFFTYDATATVKEATGSEVVYEEYYDSFTGGTNGEEAFRQKMLAKLEIYNGNDEGVNYVLREGEAVYYDEADAERMKGIGEVSYKMRCEDGGNLYEKNYDFKVNEYHEPFNEETKRIVTSGGSAYNNIAARDSLASLLKQKNDSITLLKKQRDDLLIEEAEIENDIRNNNGILTELQQKLTRVRQKITATNAMINTLEYQTSKCQDAINVFDSDMQDGEDAGSERIPHYEDELVRLYGVRWLGDGYWEGNTYKRRCNVSMAGTNNECYFIVDCTKTRGQSFFLGIRYHRAIINFSMRLTYNHSSEEVIETKTLDMRKSEQERSAEANERRRQLQEEHPGCAITMDFHKKDTIGDDPDTKNIHLLWAGDRLEVARLVDRQLHRIYTNMVITERYLRSCRRLDQMLKADLRGAIERGKEARKHHYFIRRWQDLYGFANDTAGLQAYIVNERKREKEVWDSIIGNIAEEIE